MASRKQRRKERKAAGVRRFLAAQTRVRQPSHAVPQVAPIPMVPPEPKILAEDIGKLVDFGVEQRTVDYLAKAGIRFVRDVHMRGKAETRKIYGMKSRLDQVENVLQNFGITLPA